MSVPLNALLMLEYIFHCGCSHNWRNITAIRRHRQCPLTFLSVLFPHTVFSFHFLCHCLMSFLFSIIFHLLNLTLSLRQRKKIVGSRTFLTYGQEKCTGMSLKLGGPSANCHDPVLFDLFSSVCSWRVDVPSQVAPVSNLPSLAICFKSQAMSTTECWIISLAHDAPLQVLNLLDIRDVLPPRLLPYFF